MDTQESSEHKRPATSPDEEIKAAFEKARAESKAVVARAKEERRARPKAEEALAEAQADPAAEQDRRALARAEQAKAGAEQPVSFAVRLMVDPRGQILRTHVEHAQSRKKDTFPTLDVQRLAAFMTACISLPAAQQPSAVQPEPSPARAGVTTAEIRGPAARLSISDVRVFRAETPNINALMLSPNEAWVIEARFQLQGSEAAALTAQARSFEIKVYANPVTGGAAGLLASYSTSLVENILDYTAQMQAPGLSSGLYRLVTLVTLRGPIRLVGYHEGPIVEVATAQPSFDPTTPPQVASPW